MLKKTVLCAVIVSLVLMQGVLFAQNKATDASASKEQVVTTR